MAGNHICSEMVFTRRNFLTIHCDNAEADTIRLILPGKDREIRIREFQAWGEYILSETSTHPAYPK